jgi:hypothetical protein
MSDEPESSERPEGRRSLHFPAGFSVILIGVIGLALIILMCIVVALFAYFSNSSIGSR